MPRIFVTIVALAISGLCMAQVPALPTSLSESDILAGARAIQKQSNGNSSLSVEETTKALVFSGYISGYIDANTQSQNVDPAWAACVQSKPASYTRNMVAAILAQTSRRSTGSIRADVGITILAVCGIASKDTKASGVNSSQWVKFGENARLIAYFQQDPGLQAAIPAVWVLYDSEQKSDRSSRKYTSEMAKQEVDCAQARSRTTFFTWHSASMGQDSIVYTGKTIRPWESHPPGSIGASLAAVVCKPK
jgi:hypothetical protein